MSATLREVALARARAVQNSGIRAPRGTEPEEVRDYRLGVVAQAVAACESALTGPAQRSLYEPSDHDLRGWLDFLDRRRNLLAALAG